MHVWNQPELLLLPRRPLQLPHHTDGTSFSVVGMQGSLQVRGRVDCVDLRIQQANSNLSRSLPSEAFSFVVWQPARSSLGRMSLLCRNTLLRVLSPWSCGQSM